MNFLTRGSAMPFPKSVQEFPEEWYSLHNENHFWGQWRLRVIKQLLLEQGVPFESPAKALDVGCGVGVFRKQWEQFTSWVVDGVERNPRALKNGFQGRGVVRDVDIERPPNPWVNAYDCVFVLDVLEHVAQPLPFIQGLAQCVKPGGLIVFNVPSFPKMYSAYDVQAGHFRRYTVQSLTHEMAGSPLDILRVGYWGLSLYPLLCLRTFSSVFWKDPATIIRRGFEPPGPIAHYFLKCAMRGETSLKRLMPFGTSVVLLARRK